MGSRTQTISLWIAFAFSALAFVLRITGVDHQWTLMTVLPGIAAASFGFMLWNNWKTQRG